MLKLVIAEDEDIIRMGLVQTIYWQAMEVELVGEAADGMEALEQVKKLQPDVLLTDIRMPRLSGLELADKVLAMGQRTRVVFLTSYAEFDYAREALRLQAVDYLLKPVEEEELVRVMNNIAKDLANQAELEAGGENSPVSNSEVKELTDWLELLQEPGLNPHVRRVLERIVTAYNQHLSIEELAGELQVSTSYLSPESRRRQSWN